MNFAWKTAGKGRCDSEPGGRAAIRGTDDQRQTTLTKLEQKGKQQDCRERLSSRVERSGEAARGRRSGVVRICRREEMQRTAPRAHRHGVFSLIPGRVEVSGQVSLKQCHDRDDYVHERMSPAFQDWK